MTPCLECIPAAKLKSWICLCHRVILKWHNVQNCQTTMHCVRNCGNWNQLRKNEREKGKFWDVSWKHRSLELKRRCAADCSRGDQKPPEMRVHLYICILSYALGSMLLRNDGLLSQMQKLYRKKWKSALQDCRTSKLTTIMDVCSPAFCHAVINEYWLTDLLKTPSKKI